MLAKDIFLQKAVIEGLADARDAGAVELLRQFYDAGNRHVRIWTIEALAEAGDHQVLPLLLSATTSSDEGVKLWGGVGTWLCARSSGSQLSPLAPDQGDQSADLRRDRPRPADVGRSDVCG